MRVLLVEDDPELSRRLIEGLQGEGYVVEHAGNGTAGQCLGHTKNYDAAILDLGLPDIQGVDILKCWRKSGRDMPVIILTARSSWSEKIEALNAGADDYIAKPSRVQEIAARVHMLIRHSKRTSMPMLICSERKL